MDSDLLITAARLSDRDLLTRLEWNPRPGRARAARSHHIPADVKRKVWLRDHGQCAFVSPAGRRCRERTFLEFHHLKAYSLGGETTVGNISLRCREHNVHEAELVFGPWDPGAVHESPASYSAWGGASRADHNGMGPTRPGASSLKRSRNRPTPRGA